jgi:hypothetical protein
MTQWRWLQAIEMRSCAALKAKIQTFLSRRTVWAFRIAGLLIQNQTVLQTHQTVN